MLFKFFGILGQGDVLRLVDFDVYCFQIALIINLFAIGSCKTQPFQFRHFMLFGRFGQGFLNGVFQNKENLKFDKDGRATAKNGDKLFENKETGKIEVLK